MDNIEVSRQKAEQLHNELVLDGLSPREPYLFAVAEAKRREIEVERVPKGDVRLHGARALYDPDALLILHEDIGDDFTHAFLVAHEIGHVEFSGQSNFSRTDNADPLRSSEAAPVGVDRVVDYSRREREVRGPYPGFNGGGLQEVHAEAIMPAYKLLVKYQHILVKEKLLSP